MAHTFDRRLRVADLLKQELAKLVLEHCHDPRFAFVSISAVEISKDYANAKVFVTTLDDRQIEGTIKALNKAAGFFRHQLAHRVNLRSTPKLHFYYDEALKRGQRIEQLLRESSDPNKE